MDALKFNNKIHMLFLIKHTLRSLLLIVAAVFLYQIAIQNYQHFTAHPTHPFVDSLKAFLNNTNHAVTNTIQLIHQRKITQIKLVQRFLYLFHNKVYWLVLPLALMICYYEFAKPKNKVPLICNQKVPVDKFKQQAQRLTKQQVQKLLQSQKYKDYLSKKSNQTLYPSMDKKEQQDDEFTQDWQQNESKIFD